MSVERTHRNNSADFKSLNIIYLALTAGQILIAIVLTFLQQGKELSFSWEMDNVFHLIAPFVIMSSVGLATFLYSKRIDEASNQQGLLEKFEHYKATIILRSALLEGANLLCLVFFFLEGNYFFLILFFFGFAMFLLVRPSKELFKEKYRVRYLSD